jgi:DNA topoisomerase-6 subunit B
MVLLVHIASVWVPFTSESKEAIAHYPEIVKEMRLALQECGRQVGLFIRKRRRDADEAKKRAYIEKYIPQVAIGLQQILALSDAQRDRVVVDLNDVLERSATTGLVPLSGTSSTCRRGCGLDRSCLLRARGLGGAPTAIV